MENIPERHLKVIRETVEGAGEFHEIVLVGEGRHTNIYLLVFKCTEPDGTVVYYGGEVESNLDDGDEVDFEMVSEHLRRVEKVDKLVKVWQ